MDKHTDDGSTNIRFVSYWQLLGKVVAAFCLPLLCFTVLLALRLDGVVDWSYWVVFVPLFVVILGFILATASQTLSSPAPVQVRLIWILWVIALSMFVVFLVLRLENSKLFRPSLLMLFTPLYAGLGLMFVVGFFLFISGCCCGGNAQKKYVISATPIFCFAVVCIPLVILISLKEGVETTIPHISWGVIFIPLFVCDAFCFCMGFFLLIFSFGGRNDAIFSIFQLVIFLIIIPASVTFKILLVLRLDHILVIPIIYVFIPLFVLEILLFTCGIAVVAPHKKHKYLPVKIAT